jgi:hypothetical protein
VEVAGLAVGDTSFLRAEVTGSTHATLGDTPIRYGVEGMMDGDTVCPCKLYTFGEEKWL